MDTKDRLEMLLELLNEMDPDELCKLIEEHLPSWDVVRSYAPIEIILNKEPLLYEED